MDECSAHGLVWRLHPYLIDNPRLLNGSTRVLQGLPVVSVHRALPQPRGLSGLLIKIPKNMPTTLDV